MCLKVAKPDRTVAKPIATKSRPLMDGTLDTTLDVHMGYLEIKGYGHKSEHPHLARALPLASQQPYAARWSLRCAVTTEEIGLLAKVKHVLTLWHALGKPYEPRSISTYYVEYAWDVRRLYKDLAALQESMAARARGFSLGHELYKAPFDVYQVLADHVVEGSDTYYLARALSDPTTLYLFLSTCKTFERRRLHLLSLMYNHLRKSMDEAARLELQIDEFDDAEYVSRYDFQMNTNDERDERLKQVWKRFELEARILRKEKWAVLKFRDANSFAAIWDRYY